MSQRTIKEFLTEDDAKNYACGRLAKMHTLESARDRIQTYDIALKNGSDGDRFLAWRTDRERLIAWLESDEFKTGAYPQGIDEVFLQMIEWRASVYAFSNVEHPESPFSTHWFFAQWLTGANYALFTLLGKLLGKDPRDNTLRQLWADVGSFVSASDLTSRSETDLIAAALDPKCGHFTNENSRAVLFRNKAISHNEQSPRLDWDDLDRDIRLLSRIWGLLTMWASFPVVEPFLSGERAFSGLEPVYSVENIRSLVSSRAEYLGRVREWCTADLSTGRYNSLRSPFANIQVSISLR